MATIRVWLESGDPMKRITGFGGIFFSAKDPKTLCAWYKNHLGIDVLEKTDDSEYGKVLLSDLKDQYRQHFIHPGQPGGISLLVHERAVCKSHDDSDLRT
jgi:hypothetical protein